MRKILIFVFIQLISILAFSINEGREICTQTGGTTNCVIEGLKMDVVLQVPKSIYIVKEPKVVDFDFGEVIKGNDAVAESSFKIKGDIDSKIILKLYQGGDEISKVVLNNGTNTVNLTPTIVQKSPSGDEIPVDMSLSLNGDDTINLASGEYSGVFTVRAILAERE